MLTMIDGGGGESPRQSPAPHRRKRAISHQPIILRRLKTLSEVAIYEIELEGSQENLSRKACDTRATSVDRL
jgi:hypothetical protein